MSKLTLPLLLSCSLPVFAHEQAAETIEVQGRALNLVGSSVSASEGVVGQKEIALRPLSRTGDVLELVPGMVVTQHSGTGKANQYFLRGFNLDHGTDFATVVDHMPVNMRSHGHGQGYTDLNFLIPETIRQVSYKKGAYYADVADFSGAGSAHFKTVSKLSHGSVGLTLGEHSFQRLVAMQDVSLGQDTLLAAVELNRYQGPWTNIDEDVDKRNLLLKYETELDHGQFGLTFMGYENTWNSADQIPSRAVKQGLIDAFGSIDDSVGGTTDRYSLSTYYQANNWQASAYVIQYGLNLWSNFTYFLDDPLNGDQFEQVDDRWIYGGQASLDLDGNWLGVDSSNTLGVDFRLDDISEVGLYHTKQRSRLGVTRSDAINQHSLGLYWQNRIEWTHHLSSVVAARYDYFDFDVKDKAGVNRNNVDLSVNSGQQSDDLLSLKGSVIYTFNPAWESYVSFGQGLHSNDARGTTIKVDPVDGSAVQTVDPLVRSTGYEIGLRGFIDEKINTSIALWNLELDSELLFVGDAGNTEASGASKRQGVELTAYYHINETFSFDVEYAYTDAKLDDGSAIPGAVEHVLQAGLNLDYANGWFGSLRTRYFGERALIEDSTVQSDPTHIWNLRAGYSTDKWTVTADILNLTNEQDHDVDYFYESQLSNEASPLEDIHYHVLEPRTVRISASLRF
ncbi:TonB-dependent receptor [Saccharobesus litoralis]|uniref:TonB-dependent receptor n=1 Tax=Saccharobesus litoralis TaxID=2172099 RepID=A0A2S0VNY2_9ALTE|nr:TonB-dependent receptor [Saccharobesus litoralis]AWB65927.1 TonB-dependent receptor [Saccharobesus litoralis]